MIDITVCHAAADRAAAELLRTRLDEASEARVWLEELKPGERLPDIWDRGQGSVGTLLLLSPDAIPTSGGREPWADILDHVERNETPPLATVMVRECRVPPILRRRNAFTLEAVRDIVRWAVALHADAAPSFAAAPAVNPGSLEPLESLLDSGGTVSAVKSAAAQQFARQFADHFRQTIWVACAGRSATSIACELAAALGLPVDGVDIPAIDRTLHEHRLLVILDDAPVGPPVKLAPGSRAALILTTAEPQRTAPAPENADDHRLWRALSACRPQAADIRLATRIAGAGASAVRLSGLGLIEPLDAAGTLFRVCVHAPVDDDLRRAHATALRDLFHARAAICAPLLPEADAAYAWTREADWGLAAALGESVCRFLQAHHRNAELAEWLPRLLDDSRVHNDAGLSDYCTNELTWLGIFPRAPQRASHGTQLQLPLAG